MKVEFRGELGSEVLPAISVVNVQKSPSMYVRLNLILLLPTNSVKIKKKNCENPISHFLNKQAYSVNVSS